MSNFRILDCTLRDGGYINNWKFGKEDSQKFISLLSNSLIDYIEVGFFSEESSSEDQTIFDSFSKAESFLPNENLNGELVGMITYGKYSLDKIPLASKTRIKNLRIIFKKSQSTEAILFCKHVIEKGYNVFVNPTFIDQFSDLELLDILEQINDIKPFGVSIVDSMGVLREKDVLRIFYLFDNNLSKNIVVGFHSHNNLQLSLSNSEALMKATKTRTIIIDSTVLGMGRGAGNLCTELLLQYLNDNYNSSYNILPILKIADEYINPIFALTPWGYTVPYYLSAINHCHPNYAKFLVDKQSIPVEDINSLLFSIPDNKKAVFDVELIRLLYLDKKKSEVDDISTLNYLSSLFLGRNLLLLGPGKSISEEKDNIKRFIQNTHPFIISMNFIPNEFESDLCIFTNIKRYNKFKNFLANFNLVVSTNILEKSLSNVHVISYSKYINTSLMFDNVALMTLTLLKKMGMKKVTIAGLDGFSKVTSENFSSNNLINSSKDDDYELKNQIMTDQLSLLSKDIEITYLTKTKYLKCI